MNYNEILHDCNDILLPEEVQSILKIGRNTIYSYLSNGTIKSIKIGGKYRIPKLYLLEFLYPEMDFSIQNGNKKILSTSNHSKEVL